MRNDERDGQLAKAVKDLRAGMGSAGAREVAGSWNGGTYVLERPPVVIVEVGEGDEGLQHPTRKAVDGAGETCDADEVASW